MALKDRESKCCEISFFNGDDLQKGNLIKIQQKTWEESQEIEDSKRK